MLTLFDGKLRMEEFVYGMTYKDMMALRDARVDQILAEKAENERQDKMREREAARSAILGKDMNFSPPSDLFGKDLKL